MKREHERRQRREAEDDLGVGDEALGVEAVTGGACRKQHEHTE
jgi:hypothetical protein